MMMRGIRGAITAEENTAESILAATRSLLNTIFEKNETDSEDIASILFSVTSDLNAEFPAKAARDMGLDGVPLLCFNEIQVPGGLGHCIRVLVHVNTGKSQREICHVYLGGAASLRPDHAFFPNSEN